MQSMKDAQSSPAPYPLVTAPAALDDLRAAGRTISEEGEIFYLETREQMDALFALQRKLKVKRDD